MPGRTWKRLAPDALVELRAMLVRRGGAEDPGLSNPHEAWRIRIERTVFTAYTSGTLYCNGAPLPELEFLYRSIDELARGT